MSNLLGAFVNVFWFALLLGVLIFVHELGHFTFAKLFDVKVLRFSLGFGPRLIGVRKGDTDYCVSALPLGGYVKMVGELPDSEVAEEDRPRAFSQKPVWKRAIILLCGPTANLVLALLVYVVMFTGKQTFGDTRIGVVTPAGPAWQAGLRPGDRIVAIDEHPVADWSDILTGIGGHPDAHLTMIYERGGQRKTVAVQPEAHFEHDELQEDQKRGRIGISLFYVKPVLAVVDPHSPAAKAGLQSGDVIAEVNGRKTEAWHEVKDLLGAIPAPTPIALTVKRGAQQRKISLVPTAQKPELDSSLFSAADVQGGYTGLVNTDTIIAKLDAESPAAKAGLQVGDRLLRMARRSPDGSSSDRPISVWAIDLGAFQGSDARSEFTLTYQRGEQVLTSHLQLLEKQELDEFKNKHTRWVFGAENADDTLGTYTFERTVGLGEAVGEAFVRLGDDINLIARGFERLVVGRLSIENVGGPIMLFVIAEKSARHGMEHFFRMMAVISVNLGLLNLLPIPVLDGGHLAFLGVEAVRRRPASLRVREVANAIGLALIFLLMLLAIRNDVIKYVLG